MFYVDVYFKKNHIATHSFEFESKALELINRIKESNYGYHVVMRNDNMVIFDEED